MCGSLMALLPTVLAGCATPGFLCTLPPGPSRITLIAEPDANADTAVAVDLLMISDTLAAEQIAPLSAADYFARRTQLMRDWGAGIVLRSWEVAPGQVLRDAPTRPSCNRVKTLLFARYQTPGDHRQALDGADAVVVALGAQDFTVTP